MNKPDLKFIALVVVSLLVGILFYVAMRPNKTNSRPETGGAYKELTDSLIMAYKRKIRQDSLALRERDLRIAELEKDNAAKDLALTQSRSRQVIIKKKSDEVKKAIDSDNFNRDSIRRAFAEFE